MNKLLFAFALAAATFVHAQGTIQFINNPVTRFRFFGVIPPNASAGGPVGGTYFFGVFAGTSSDNLSGPVFPLGTNSSAGGGINAPNSAAYQIPGTSAGQVVFIQIRMWESRFGSDWERASAEGIFGRTAVLPFVLGPAIGPGTVIWAASPTDLNKLQGIDFIPEPSTAALAGLGLGALLLCFVARRSRLTLRKKFRKTVDTTGGLS